MPPPYPASQIGILFRRDERELVEKYGKFVAPFFAMEISDQNNNILFSAESNAVDGNYDLNGLIISTVEWEENDCQADMMSFTVNNIDMEIHDSRLFAEGNSVDLWMGYDGLQPEYMGRGIIVTVEPEFAGAGIPTLRITCYDISHFMMEEGKAEVQTEGTKWFERRSVPAEGDGNLPPEVGDNAIPDNPDQLAATADRVASRTDDSPTVSTPTHSISDAPAGSRAATTPIVGFTVAAGTTPDQETQQPSTRTTIQRARIPRRRQKKGKVWRNLRDDEIAATIFESYGIVPYTQAVDQRSRSRRVTRLQNERGTVITLEHRDTNAQQQLATQEAIRLGVAAGTIPATAVDSLTNNDSALHDTSIGAVVVGGGLQLVTENIDGRRIVQKAGTNDWDFLKKLAKNHGYIVFVFYYHENGTWIGYWGSPNNVPQHVSYSFEYNNGDDTTIATFKPKISMRGQKTDIDLIYTDPVLRKQQRLRVSMENLSHHTTEFRGPDATSRIEEPLGNGPEVVLTIHGQRVAVTANRRFTSMDDARRWLMAYWYRHASEFCEAEGSCIVGIPEIRCRHKHMIGGFGRYDGKYFFTKVTHRMGTGNTYSTEWSTFRMADILEGEPDQENDSMSVESNNMGEITPEARDVIRRWQESLSVR